MGESEEEGEIAGAELSKEVRAPKSHGARESRKTTYHADRVAYLDTFAETAKATVMPWWCDKHGLMFRQPRRNATD